VETESEPRHKEAQRCLYFDRFLEPEWVKNSGEDVAAKDAHRCPYFDRFLEAEWVKNSGEDEGT